MLKKYLFLFSFSSFFCLSQVPENYYTGTEGLSGYQLKSKLHDIIAAKNVNWHYDDLKTLYGKTDIDNFYDYDATNTTYLLDIYSNNPAGTTAYHYTLNNIVSGAGAEGLGWNREHMMPQSTFNSAYPMYSDLFFVIPTDARINQLRSNYPYGVAGKTVNYNFTNGSKQAFNGTPNAIYTGRIYEPIDEFKGDVARSLLYFAVRYEGLLGSFNYSTNADPTKDQNPMDGTEERSFDNWYIDMLLSWNAKDPVSAREIARNNAVYNIQKNRNPFIDHPEWVDLIWKQIPDNMAPSAPSELTLERNSAYFVTLKWQKSPESDVLGYKIYRDGNLIGTSATNTFSADHLTPGTTYNFMIKAYDNAYLLSPESNTMSVTTLASDIFAKDIQIIKYLEGTDNNRAIEIANKTGHKVNLSTYKLNMQQNIKNYFFGEALTLEGTLDDNKSVVVINPKANFSCFDTPEAQFISNSPALSFDGAQYVELSYNSKALDAIGIKDTDNNINNVSLYRKSSVLDPTSSFNINEWVSYPKDYCLGLGSLGVGDVAENAKAISVYPNPTAEKLYINGDVAKVKIAQVFDLSGKLIMTINNPFASQKTINVQALPANTYILSLDGQTLLFIKK